MRKAMTRQQQLAWMRTRQARVSSRPRLVGLLATCEDHDDKVEYVEPCTRRRVELGPMRRMPGGWDPGQLRRFRCEEWGQRKVLTVPEVSQRGTGPEELVAVDRVSSHADNLDEALCV